MNNKLKLILWGKNLQLPIDYDNLKFDNYELKYNNEYELYFYKNNELIKKIWYWSDGKLCYEFNYKNGKWNGKQYGWYPNGKLSHERNYKNGKEDGKQYGWYNNEKLCYEFNYKNGIEI